ncbi:AbrB family transcriptional regulator [Leptolyngbya sp. FACHB-261]|uniref:AbrB family transcriptional regulator n=1 Tax=Leptolyngbya sp. FACHB-261 TaxID=2692806 RepID=UPI001684E0DF|nr:AbrB family transcriptional regulator [Leptolyngbya sp. FACHB-261]MBD2101904.1 AbrB family transcriptional regulator [Leptolyngbya sp. FACHB-261]
MPRKKAEPETSKPETAQPLTGRELLDKVKSLTGLSKKEKARACGYVSTTPSRGEQVNLIEFYKALIEAEGIVLDDRDKVAGQSRGGRSASYNLKVQKNGQVMIGAAHTRQMGLEPGDQVTLKVGRKYIQLLIDNQEED